MPATQKWEIIFFQEEDGSEPVKEYILMAGRDAKVLAMLLNVLQSLQTLGPELQGTKMDKHIEGPIRELRKDRHRILYGRVGNTFVLLTAFLKDTQKTPLKQIELAKERYEFYLKTHRER
jgi:phage-related protein